MTLEEKFDGVELTEREFRRLKRDALSEQFKKIKVEKEKKDSSKPTYDISVVRDLFKGSDVSEEIISQELEKIQQKRKIKLNPKKIKQNLQRIVKPIILSVCITSGLGGAIYSYSSVTNLLNNKKEFDTTYQEVISKYGDYDGNGLISRQEQYQFITDVIRGHNAKFIENTGILKSFTINIPSLLWNAKYLEGSYVPNKTIIQWLKEYDQKNSSK